MAQKRRANSAADRGSAARVTRRRTMARDLALETTVADPESMLKKSRAKKHAAAIPRAARATAKPRETAETANDKADKSCVARVIAKGTTVGQTTTAAEAHTVQSQMPSIPVAASAEPHQAQPASKASLPFINSYHNASIGTTLSDLRPDTANSAVRACTMTSKDSTPSLICDPLASIEATPIDDRPDTATSAPQNWIWGQPKVHFAELSYQDENVLPRCQTPVRGPRRDSFNAFEMFSPETSKKNSPASPQISPKTTHDTIFKNARYPNTFHSKPYPAPAMAKEHAASISAHRQSLWRGNAYPQSAQTGSAVQQWLDVQETEDDTISLSDIEARHENYAVR